MLKRTFPWLRYAIFIPWAMSIALLALSLSSILPQPLISNAFVTAACIADRLAIVSACLFNPTLLKKQIILQLFALSLALLGIGLGQFHTQVSINDPNRWIQCSV